MNYTESQLTELAASAILRQIAELNISALTGDRALEEIFYALPPEERVNTGRVREGWLKKYRHIREDGGLAFFGVDPLTGDRLDCISFKPTCPTAADRKYENPPKSKSRAFYPAVTYQIMGWVSERFGVDLPEISITAVKEHPHEEAKEFWGWVLAHPDIPIILTEGCKKALSTISLGFPAIGLTGIWNGVQAVRDDNGKTTEYHLIDSLQWIKGCNRSIYIAFDRDTKAATIKAVAQARLVLAKLLIESGSEVFSIRWDNKNKGIDDLIAAGGLEALEEVIAAAVALTSEEVDKKHYIYPNILAESIVKEWREWLCYDITSKKWKVYKGGVWLTKDKEEIENLFYCRVLEDVPQVKSFNYVIEVTRFARCLLALGKWDEVSSLEYLPFENGVWSFADQVLLPHDPKYRLSWKLDRNYSPIDNEWDAIATFLQQVTGEDQALVELLIAACAAVLQGRADLHKALYLFGEGRNGKGAFVRILELLVGQENKHSSNLESLCENRFEISNLLGKRLVVCADEDPRVKRFSMFKKITGGDYLRGEDKGCKAFNFLFHGMVVLASNKPVFIGDDSYGLTDRLIPIPFGVTIAKEDRRNLEPEFRSCLPSFTTYLLGLDREWVTRTLLDAKSNKSIRKLEWELETETNSVAAFYEERLYYDAAAETRCADFYQRYDEYCHAKGLQRKAENNFCKSLVAVCKNKLNLDVKSEKFRDGKHIFGLRFRTDFDPFGDECDGVTAVTVKKGINNFSQPPCDSVTAVTVEQNFSTVSDPKPPTTDRLPPGRVKVDEYFTYQMTGETVDWLELAFNNSTVAYRWRSYMEDVYGASVSKPEKITRNGSKYLIHCKKITLEMVRKIELMDRNSAPVASRRW